MSWGIAIRAGLLALVASGLSAVIAMALTPVLRAGTLRRLTGVGFGATLLF